MKKLILLLSVVVLMISCKKEEDNTIYCWDKYQDELQDIQQLVRNQAISLYEAEKRIKIAESEYESCLSN